MSNNFRHNLKAASMSSAVYSVSSHGRSINAAIKFSVIPAVVYGSIEIKETWRFDNNYHKISLHCTPNAH